MRTHGISGTQRTKVKNGIIVVFSSRTAGCGVKFIWRRNIYWSLANLRRLRLLLTARIALLFSLPRAPWLPGRRRSPKRNKISGDIHPPTKAGLQQYTPA